jgi:hypothetical protein
MHQTREVTLTGEVLRALQENVTIAILRRPSLGLAVKGTGIRERHFPRDLRPAFRIAMTMSQDEIRHLVMLRDPRIWPLYGKQIIEWNEGQARAAARQLMHSIERSAGDGPISVVDPDDSSVSAPEVKQAAARQLGIGCSEDYDPVSIGCPHDDSVSAPEAKPTTPLYETPEKQVLFEKTLLAIRQIIGDLEDISSKRLTEELTRIEGGPWAQWGKGRKPITQNALARLLKPYNVSPTDVGPEHARRKGYRRAQFERL